MDSVTFATHYNPFRESAMPTAAWLLPVDIYHSAMQG